MKSLPRLYIPEAVSGTTCSLSQAQNHHLRRVLRLNDGAELGVFDGKGNEFEASLRMDEKIAHAVIKELVHHEAPPALAITLVAAISRATRMEWTLEKAVELGVASIYPVQSELSKVRLQNERIEKRLAHWHTVIVSAAAQCGRARLPKLCRPTNLAEALSGIQDPSRIALLPDADTPLPSLPPPQRSLALLVGPESGFSDKEVAMISATGWQPARLGPRTLRAETAGPAALAAVQTLWGDWRS